MAAASKTTEKQWYVLFFGQQHNTGIELGYDSRVLLNPQHIGGTGPLWSRNPVRRAPTFGLPQCLPESPGQFF